MKKGLPSLSTRRCLLQWVRWMYESSRADCRGVSGEGCDAKPGGFKDYDNVVSVFLFSHNFPLFERERD